jgi:hypothetical protein
MRLLVGLIALAVGNASSYAACQKSQITIKQADWVGSKIVGEITNNCSEPVGVQLQVVFRDAAGKVIATEEFWPASTRNIDASASYAFSRHVNAPQPNVTMTISVIDTRQW